MLGVGSVEVVDGQKIEFRNREIGMFRDGESVPFLEGSVVAGARPEADLIRYLYEDNVPV